MTSSTVDTKQPAHLDGKDTTGHMYLDSIDAIGHHQTTHYLLSMQQNHVDGMDAMVQSADIGHHQWLARTPVDTSNMDDMDAMLHS